MGFRLVWVCWDVLNWLASALVLVGLLAPGFARPQEDNPPESAAPDYSFWSGIIAELEDGALIVRRALSGRKPEVRRFLLNGDTIVEGELRANARVTVAFVESDEGDLAKRILVRTR